MHILLTDLLTCPRCGPRFGLVLLADEMANRDIRAGHLGCPNCREEYPIRHGVADLRPDRSGPADAAVPAPRDAEGIQRLAALLGVTSGSGSLLLLGASAADAAALANLLPFLQVVTAHRADAAGEGSVVVGEAFPFRDRAFRGVAVLDAATPPELLADAARLLLPAGRLVLDPAPPGVAARLHRAGLHLLLDQEGVVVASIP